VCSHSLDVRLLDCLFVCTLMMIRRLKDVCKIPLSSFPVPASQLLVHHLEPCGRDPGKNTFKNRDASISAVLRRVTYMSVLVVCGQAQDSLMLTAQSLG
jgi:hypothetical protein